MIADDAVQEIGVAVLPARRRVGLALGGRHSVAERERHVSHKYPDPEPVRDRRGARV